MQTTDHAPSAVPFESFADQLRVDPYPVYAQMRQTGVGWHRHPKLPQPLPVLSRYHDVHAVLRHSRMGRQGVIQASAAAVGTGELASTFGRWMLFLDPPDHTRLRTLVMRAFTPQAVELMRAAIQQTVDELLDRVQERGHMDLLAEFARPLPVRVICSLLGVPPADRERFGGWSEAIAKALDFSYDLPPEAAERANQAAAGSNAYFRELAARRRAEPGEDLLSALVQGEGGERLTEDELLATCVLIFFAGHETTVNLIGNGLLALLRHPDQLERLRADPALAPTAVEELLRYDSPVQRTGRTALAEVELAGLRLQPGDRVIVLVGSANRDPAQFAEPDRLDVGRRDNHHLSFGGGIHYCVGAPLARLEGELALNSLLQRLPGLRLAVAPDALSWRQTFVLRGLEALPVRW
jgi:pimeloyl-[acyl-carrier protein] synthase